MHHTIAEYIPVDLGEGLTGYHPPAGVTFAMSLCVPNNPLKRIGLFSSLSPLGTGIEFGDSLPHQTEIPARNKAAIASYLQSAGYDPLTLPLATITLADLIQWLYTAASDPAGNTRLKPIVPRRDGGMELHGPGIVRSLATPSKVYREQKLEPLYRAEYQRLREAVRRGDAPNEAHLKWLYSWQQKFGRLGFDYTRLQSGDALDRQPVKHDSQYREIWPTVESSTGTLSNQIHSWTMIAGTGDVTSANRFRNSTVSNGEALMSVTLGDDDQFAEHFLFSGASGTRQTSTWIRRGTGGTGGYGVRATESGTDFTAIVYNDEFTQIGTTSSAAARSGAGVRIVADGSTIRGKTIDSLGNVTQWMSVTNTDTATGQRWQVATAGLNARMGTNRWGTLDQEDVPFGFAFPAPASAEWSAPSTAQRKTIAVNPATATWSALSPTWSKTATPAAVTLAWSAPAPVCDKLVEANAVSTQWSAMAPTTIKSVNASPVSAQWSAPEILQQQIVTPDPVSAQWHPVEAAAVKSVSPATVSAQWSALAPTIAKRLTASPPTATWGIVSPSLAKTLGVDPATTEWASQSPSLAKSRSVNPGTATWSAPRPLVPQTTRPSPVSAQWSAPAPIATTEGSIPDCVHLTITGLTSPRIANQSLTQPGIMALAMTSPRITGLALAGPSITDLSLSTPSITDLEICKN